MHRRFLHTLPLLICLILPMLSGCQLSLSKQELADQPLKVSIFDAGRLMKSYDAQPDSLLHGQISDLILLKSKGWSPNFVTYAPGVMIYGDGFNINFLGEIAVYNGATGQLTRKIKPEEYLFMISGG